MAGHGNTPIPYHISDTRMVNLTGSRVDFKLDQRDSYKFLDQLHPGEANGEVSCGWSQEDSGGSLGNLIYDI